MNKQSKMDIQMLREKILNMLKSSENVRKAALVISEMIKKK